VSVSDIYGAEHLLRLFVKLPGLLSHTQMDAKETSALTIKLAEFLKWLQKKMEFFATEYLPTDKEYAKKVEIPTNTFTKDNFSSLSNVSNPTPNNT